MSLGSNVLVYSKSISNLKNLKVRLRKGKSANNINTIQGRELTSVKNGIICAWETCNGASDDVFLGK